MSEEAEAQQPIIAGAGRRRHAREGGYGWIARNQAGQSFQVLDLSLSGMRLAIEDAQFDAQDSLSFDLIASDETDNATGVLCHAVRISHNEVALSFDTEQPELEAAHRRSLARLAKAALAIC